MLEMPHVLKNLLGAEVGLSVVLACILIFTDTEQAGPFSTLAALLPIALCIAFGLRIRWADIALSTYCGVAVAIGLTFTLLQFITTSSIIFSSTNLLMIAEMGITGLLFVSIRSREVRRWFEQSRVTPGSAAGYKKDE